jgi:hypothetical protein
MPITRWTKASMLDAERVAILNRAFLHALRELGLVDRADPLTEIVGATIIEVGASGISDAEEIARIAISRLKEGA